MQPPGQVHEGPCQRRRDGHPAGAEDSAEHARVEHARGREALGFGQTVEALSGHRLLAIHQFELDDPGDTVLVSTLLQRLVEAGVRVAATSNTLPGSLGEGRFAAQECLREIQTLAGHFSVVRVDGEDYRHRGLPDAPAPVSDDAVLAGAATVAGATCDDFGPLLAHLSSLHPSRYGALVDDVPLVGLVGVEPVSDQSAALRLVVLADRLYDRDIPVLTSGVQLDRLSPTSCSLADSPTSTCGQSVAHRPRPQRS